MPLSPHRPKHKFLLMAAGATALILVGVIAASIVLLSGVMSTEATAQHFRITHRLLDVGLRFSVRQSAKGIEAPSLLESAMIERGLACYRTYCVQCHGSPASGRYEHAQGLLPAASGLAQSAREWPAEELYYVIKRGVRMTGMPAWEYRLSDDGLWSTVAFLQILPLLTREEYLQMETAALMECPRSTELPVAPSKENAEIMLLQYSCHSCHEIEGVVGPKTRVGPPLVDWSRRKYIAGVLPNTHENLIRWIRDPPAVSPGTLMPRLDVPEAHAREMAAYLLALE